MSKPFPGLNMEKTDINTMNGTHKVLQNASHKLNKNVYTVFLILLMDLIAFTIILPLLPSILDNYEARQELKEDIPLHLLHNGMNWLKEQLQVPGERQYNNVLIGGILGSLFSSLQFLSNPVFGLLSDISGRKPILLISMAGTALSYVLWMQANTFTLFLVSRLVGGLSKGSVTICTAIMADLTSKETRGKAMALVGVAFSIGFSIGPLVGAYFAAKTQLITGSQLHSTAPLICIVLQALTMLMVVLLLEESQKHRRKLPRQEVVKFCLSHLNPFAMLSRISSTKSARDAKMSVVWSLGITQFFYLVLFSGLEFTLTFLTHERFLFSRREQGVLFLFIGIFMSLTQGGYVRRVKHGNEKRVALQGIGVLIPAMVIVALATTVSMVYIGVFLYCFGAATVIPCLTTLVSNQAGNDDNGEILGIFRSLGALARAFGPFLTCSLYWSVGSTVCYFVGGVLFLVPLLLLSRIQVDTKTA